MKERGKDRVNVPSIPTIWRIDRFFHIQIYLSNSLIIHRVKRKKKSQAWRRFGYPVFISIDFDDFTLPCTLSFLFRLKRYIKHSRQCFIGFPNTSIEFRQKHPAARRIFNFLPAPKTIPAWAPDNTTFSKRNTNFLAFLTFFLAHTFVF